MAISWHRSRNVVVVERNHEQQRDRFKQLSKMQTGTTSATMVTQMHLMLTSVQSR